LNDANALGFRLPLVNVGQENEGRSFVPRLFRNAPGVFFHGRIHEQVFPSLLPLCKMWGMTTALGAAELKHHGYTKEMVRDRNKIERNLKLLRLGLAETPSDVNLVMNLGMELVRSGDLQNGLAKYREAFALMSAQSAASVVPELREALLSQFTSQLYKIRGHDEVVRVLNSKLAKNGGLTASLHFALGLSLFELKNFVGAVEQMRQCLAKKDLATLTPINVDIHSAAPWHCRALGLARLGEKAAAEKCFIAAVTIGVQANEARIDFAKFLVEQNRGVEALQIIYPVVEVDKQCLVAWRIGGQIALSRNEFLEFAQDWTGEAIQYFPGDVMVQAQRAEALLLAGKTTEALPLWRVVREKDGLPRSLAALILCGLCAGEKISAPGSAAEEEQISRVFIGWYQRLLGAGAHAAVAKLNSQLGKCSALLPTAEKMLRAAFSEVAQGNVTPV
jgi:tetratricopeptide (TPR) repeat protein